MTIQRTPMTRAGFDRLREELERLKKVDRLAISRAIAEARAHGDLSENAEYHAAREKQAMTEARIKDLEAKLGTAEVLDLPTSGDRIIFGSTVRLEDEDGKALVYQIVGSEEAEPARGRISVMSPLARTLIGKKVGDSVIAQVPAGKKTYDVLEANFPGPPRRRRRAVLLDGPAQRVGRTGRARIPPLVVIEVTKPRSDAHS